MTLIFGDLNQDIKYDVLKYLNLIERVKLERVNQEWGQVIDSIWRSQLALQISSKPVNIPNSDLEIPCIQDCHQVRKKDAFTLGSFDGLTRMPPAMIALLSKCTNLQALYIIHSPQHDITCLTLKWQNIFSRKTLVLPELKHLTLSFVD